MAAIGTIATAPFCFESTAQARKRPHSARRRELSGVSPAIAARARSVKNVTPYERHVIAAVIECVKREERGDQRRDRVAARDHPRQNTRSDRRRQNPGERNADRQKEPARLRPHGERRDDVDERRIDRVVVEVRPYALRDVGAAEEVVPAVVIPLADHDGGRGQRQPDAARRPADRLDQGRGDRKRTFGRFRALGRHCLEGYNAPSATAPRGTPLRC